MPTRPAAIDTSLLRLTRLLVSGPLLEGPGSIGAVNTAALVPEHHQGICGDGRESDTAVFTQPERESFLLLSFGRYNVVNLLHEHFFAGGGIKRFFNIAQIGPITTLRQINPVSARQLAGPHEAAPSH